MSFMHRFNLWEAQPIIGIEMKPAKTLLDAQLSHVNAVTLLKLFDKHPTQILKLINNAAQRTTCHL